DGKPVVAGLRDGVEFEQGLASMDFAEAVRTINAKFSVRDLSFTSSHPEMGREGVLVARADEIAERMARGQTVTDAEINGFQSDIAQGTNILDPEFARTYPVLAAVAG